MGRPPTCGCGCSHLSILVGIEADGSTTYPNKVHAFDKNLVLLWVYTLLPYSDTNYYKSITGITMDTNNKIYISWTLSDNRVLVYNMPQATENFPCGGITVLDNNGKFIKDFIYPTNSYYKRTTKNKVDTLRLVKSLYFKDNYLYNIHSNDVNGNFITKLDLNFNIIQQYGESNFVDDIAIGVNRPYSIGDIIVDNNNDIIYNLWLYQYDNLINITKYKYNTKITNIGILKWDQQTGTIDTSQINWSVMPRFTYNYISDKVIIDKVPHYNHYGNYDKALTDAWCTTLLNNCNVIILTKQMQSLNFLYIMQNDLLNDNSTNKTPTYKRGFCDYQNTGQGDRYFINGDSAITINPVLFDTLYTRYGIILQFASIQRRSPKTVTCFSGNILVWNNYLTFGTLLIDDTGVFQIAKDISQFDNVPLFKFAYGKIDNTIVAEKFNFNTGIKRIITLDGSLNQIKTYSFSSSTNYNITAIHAR